MSGTSHHREALRDLRNGLMFRTDRVPLRSVESPRGLAVRGVRKFRGPRDSALRVVGLLGSGREFHPASFGL